MEIAESWGRFPKATQEIVRPSWLSDIELPLAKGKSLLAYGQGRSYGDCCLNDGGTLISTAGLDRIIAFDPERGLIRAEAGLTLDRLLSFAVPRGWFVPVTPGTRFVSLGGALANDVHGKNHHRAGNFGKHVVRFMIMRSDGSKFECSNERNQDLYRATIAGLGLTGLVLWVDLELRSIVSPLIEAENVKFRNLDEFFEISQGSESHFEYTVAWLDCVSSAANFGRGIFMRGNHSQVPAKRAAGRPWLTVPFDLPSWVLNPYSIRAFNEVYYHLQFNKTVKKQIHYQPFFYPLDSVLNWNRIYGKNGFFQFQCVLPGREGRDGLRTILQEIVKQGRGSFLAVLKEFGAAPSPGLMSFPREGVTLCLDFKNEGPETIKFLNVLDVMVRELGGAIYPAKDALMSPESFASYYPKADQFAKFIDQRFSSSFWRRVRGVNG